MQILDQPYRGRRRDLRGRQSRPGSGHVLGGHRRSVGTVERDAGRRGQRGDRLVDLLVRQPQAAEHRSDALGQPPAYVLHRVGQPDLDHPAQDLRQGPVGDPVPGRQAAPPQHRRRRVARSNG